MSHVVLAAEGQPLRRSCHYCGLPVRRALSVSDEVQYCCLGCQLADAITSERTNADAGLGRTAVQLGLAIFFSMNVMVFTMALWSWDAYAIATVPSSAILKELLRFACCLFATPVLVLLGRPLVSSVTVQLRQGLVTADFLLLVGVVAAFGYSVVSLTTGQPHVYFEVACMILVALTLGRWLEAEGKQRAMKSLQSLQHLLPTTTRVVTADNTIVDRPLADIRVGEVVRVLAGERLPLDGTVQLGHSYVDQQLVTGESQAVCKAPPDPVHGGTLNLDGRLDILVSSTAAEGTIQRLVDSVRNAANQTSRPQRLADRLASVFVPIVMLIAATVFWAHWTSGDIHTAWMSSMAVALIACPCALAIATPLAIWAALGNAAKQGIIFRTCDDLTALAEVDYVCFDKTGTMTTDKPRLTKAVYDQDSVQVTALDITQQLTAQSLHPLADALNEWLAERPSTSNLTVGPTTTLPGRGISAKLSLPPIPPAGQRTVVAALGSTEFFQQLHFTIPSGVRQACDEAITAGLSIVCVGWDQQVQAVFSFEETLRSDAETTLNQLRKRHVQTQLLTGDQRQRAQRLAEPLDLPVAANLLPADKLKKIADLQQAGHHVAMVGDGLNDAPALSAANVGIALGCGADITRDAADVCLMSSSLGLLPWAVDLARATKRTIRRNLIWAVAYNSFGIGLAAAGKLNPIFAAMAMVCSSAFVIAESLRLAALPGPVRAAVSQHAAVPQLTGNVDQGQHDEHLVVEVSG